MNKKTKENNKVYIKDKILQLTRKNHIVLLLLAVIILITLSFLFIFTSTNYKKEISRLRTALESELSSKSKNSLITENPTQIPIQTDLSEEDYYNYDEEEFEEDYPICSEEQFTRILDDLNDKGSNRYSLSTNSFRWNGLSWANDIEKEEKKNYQYVINDRDDQNATCIGDFTNESKQLLKSKGIEFDNVRPYEISYQKKGVDHNEIIFIDLITTNIYKADLPNFDNWKTLSKSDSSLSEIGEIYVHSGAHYFNNMLTYEIRSIPWGCTEAGEYCDNMAKESEKFDSENRRGLWIYDPVNNIHKRIYTQKRVYW